MTFLPHVQVSESIFTKFKYLQINNKICKEIFLLMRCDDKCLNFLNWFINDRVMTFLLFSLDSPMRRTSFRIHF